MARELDSDTSTGWAQSMRKTAREWLDMTPARRIVRAAREKLAELDKAAPTYDAEKMAKRAEQRASREQWIRDYGDEAAADEPNPLAEYSDDDIRAEFFRRGLSK